MQAYTLKKLAITDPIPFALLLLADETVDAIERYIYKSNVYTAHSNNDMMPIAAFALYPADAQQIEIKNIAVSQAHQGQGMGSWLLKQIIAIVRATGYKEIIVGTADRGLREISFYEKNGFVQYGKKEHFFIDNYPEPIIENGIQLKDMIMLRMDI